MSNDDEIRAAAAQGLELLAEGTTERRCLEENLDGLREVRDALVEKGMNPVQAVSTIVGAVAGRLSR